MHALKMEPLQKRGRRISSVLMVIGLTLLVLLYNWVGEAIPQAHISPKVELLNIGALVEREEWSDPQLTVLSQQTGLHECVVKRLLEQGCGQHLMELQETYFAPVLVESMKTTPITVSEYVVDEKGQKITGMPLVDICNGDILITKNSRFLGWRNGHAGLVVDAEEGLILEAIMPGTNSKISRIEKWTTYPSFVVLRLKEDAGGSETGIIPQEVAYYATSYLVDVPYHLLAGVGERMLPGEASMVHAAGSKEEKNTTIRGTQCAHLVWYAYMQFGIDLDSDGGWIVTPNDIQNSEYLEVIQSFGY